MDVVIEEGKRYRLFKECQSSEEAVFGVAYMRELTNNMGWVAIEVDGKWGIYLRLRD